MKNILFALFCILLLANCNNPTPAIETKSNADTLPSNYSKIQHLYKEVSPDTFYVYSEWETNKKDFPFKGQAMDSLQVALLPYDIKSSYSLNKDFGACYKFPIDENNVALITRVSGEYVSSAIKLFVFDLKKDSIVKTFNLADNVAEGGNATVFNSCIFKDEKQRMLLLMYSWSSLDHTFGNVTNETDTMAEYWYSYYLMHFKNNTMDTLSEDSAEIAKAYPNLLKELTAKEF